MQLDSIRSRARGNCSWPRRRRIELAMALPNAAALAAAVERDGFCVLPEALSQPDLRALQGAFAAALEAPRRAFEANGRQNFKVQP